MAVARLLIMLALVVASSGCEAVREQLERLEHNINVWLNPGTPLERVEGEGAPAEDERGDAEPADPK